MTTNFESKGWQLVGGHLALGLGLSMAVLVFGVAGARADSSASFGNQAPGALLAAVEPRQLPVDTLELADERAKGFTPGMVSAPEENGKVAVILWDDAWSELQRRARSAGTAASIGSNAGSSLAGSSGSSAN